MNFHSNSRPSGLNIITRRDFLAHSLRAGAALGLLSLANIPPFARRALATPGLGSNGKKLLFIFLRGANDALNSCIPVLDPAYNAGIRPNLFIPSDILTNYGVPGPCDFPTGLASTFAYANAIRLGNGFAGLHPSMKFLAPVYNAGDLAIVQRVAYPRQSRSHFDSQNYWENGDPNSGTRDGIFYRTLLESGLTTSNPLTGVSVQGGLPLLFKGPEAALVNMSDPTRYDLMGVPSVTGDAKAMNALLAAQTAEFADKRSRNLLSGQYQSMVDTLNLFSTIDFTEAGNTFVDNTNTDGTTPYNLFPTTNAKNGGGTAASYVVDPGGYSFFTQLKGAALILNKTDAVITGTEMGGFDTHNNQGGVTGAHANLVSRVAYALYGLRKYFMLNSDKVTWNNLTIVVMTEFGRTTVQNSNNGTDHAEAGMMLVAGGGVKGYGKAGRTSGVFGCHTGDSVPWLTGTSGSMYGVASRYLKRAIDFRSVLGEIIREHLGATQPQLDRIISGYATPGENLLSGGTSAIDGTPIMGELDIV